MRRWSARMASSSLRHIQIHDNTHDDTDSHQDQLVKDGGQGHGAGAPKMQHQDGAHGQAVHQAEKVAQQREHQQEQP